MTLERECGEVERDDDGHFVLETSDVIHLENGDWALDRAPYNEDRDDDVTVPELATDYEEHVEGARSRFLAWQRSFRITLAG